MWRGYSPGPAPRRSMRRQCSGCRAPSGGTIAAWADHVEAHGDPRPRWEALPAEELLAEIMALRGFGRWSAEMLAIFGFAHPDIWPEGDAGVQRVMRRLFPRMKPPGRRALVAGHATYVSLCCWTVINRGLEDRLG